MTCASAAMLIIVLIIIRTSCLSCSCSSSSSSSSASSSSSSAASSSSSLFLSSWSVLHLGGHSHDDSDFESVLMRASLSMPPSSPPPPLTSSRRSEVVLHSTPTFAAENLQQAKRQNTAPAVLGRPGPRNSLIHELPQPRNRHLTC